MAPGKTYIHKMDASELTALSTESPSIVVWWGPDKHDLHNPSNIIYQKYPAKVLAAFSDAFGDNPKVAEFVAWPRAGVVKVVLDWMLESSKDGELKPVKDIELDLNDLASAKGDGEFSRFFKTAYLFDFAQEYKIKFLEDKLKREMEFMAKGKFALRVEEVYDMANYFAHQHRDQTAITLMIDSIARGVVKEDIRGGRKRMYDEELAIWDNENKSGCHDLSGMLADRIEYFQKPENAEELNEQFGKKKEEEAPAVKGNAGWGNGEGFDAPAAFDIWKGGEGDKENQAPGTHWADDANNNAATDQWGGAIAESAPTGGW